HNRAWAISYDIEVGRESYDKNKVKKVIYLQHARPLFDLLGTCRFQWLETGIELDVYAQFYKAATGIKTTAEDLLRASERVYNLARAISIREGLTSKEDWLPERSFTDPVPEGVVKGATLDKRKFKRMVKTYYKLRGWDEKGVPTLEKLKELDLRDVSQKLHAS
nr:aldehyde ferredoxin oxidoreductase [Candidatus Bathyarchaeota archaeon]